MFSGNPSVDFISVDCFIGIGWYASKEDLHITSLFIITKKLLLTIVKDIKGIFSNLYWGLHG